MSRSAARPPFVALCSGIIASFRYHFFTTTQRNVTAVFVFGWPKKIPNTCRPDKKLTFSDAQPPSVLVIRTMYTSVVSHHPLTLPTQTSHTHTRTPRVYFNMAALRSLAAAAALVAGRKGVAAQKIVDDRGCVKKISSERTAKLINHGWQYFHQQSTRTKYW